MRKQVTSRYAKNSNLRSLPAGIVSLPGNWPTIEDSGPAAQPGHVGRLVDLRNAETFDF